MRNAHLKTFFRWLRDTDEDPPEVKRLVTTKPQDSSLDPDDLIQPADLRAMLRSCSSPQDWAILALLWEMGPRASEFCALNIGNVHFEKIRGTLTALVAIPKGAPHLKTGHRTVRVFEAAPYLLNWLTTHPCKNLPDSPLFFTRSHRKYGSRFTPSALWTYCTGIAKLTGLEVHANPHKFRHSSATEFSLTGASENEMRAKYGWSKSSRMPSYYTHLRESEVGMMTLSRRGLLDESEDVKPALAFQLCRSCKDKNPPHLLVCQHCKCPLSQEAEELLKRQRQEEIEAEARKLLENEDRFGLDAPDLHAWAFQDPTPGVAQATEGA